MPEVVDVRLLYRKRILRAAGDHGHSVRLDPREPLRVIEPCVGDVCEPTHGEHRFGDLPRPRAVFQTIVDRRSSGTARKYASPA